MTLTNADKQMKLVHFTDKQLVLIARKAKAMQMDVKKYIQHATIQDSKQLSIPQTPKVKASIKDNIVKAAIPKKGGKNA